MNWKIARLVVVILISLGVWQPMAPSEGNIIGLGLLAIVVALAVFQAIVWLLYDVVTLKKGVWIKPNLSANPFRKNWPVSTSFFALLLGVAGFFAVIFSLIQGLDKAILGGWLLLSAAILHGTQSLLCRAFSIRFKDH